MKIRYGGQEYTQKTARRGAAPLHMIEMQAQSRRAEVRELLPDGEPLSLSVLSRWGKEIDAWVRDVARWQRAATDGTQTADDEPTPPECATWMTVVSLYLTLRSGGWQGTLLDAAAIPEGEVRYVREVSDGLADEPDDDEDGEGASEAADPTSAASPAGPETSDDAASLDESPAVAAAGEREPLT